ncbi:MAG: UDP-N-acetylmuramate--L-alanine ligase [Phycisphaerales bacterium]|nr:UDP-N-acetylmuramate--L-alanine ligase [Phycisphaerales bacterium]
MNPPAPNEFQSRRIHMVGIGGAGMSGLAAMLLRHGARVSGSDARMSILLAKLASDGAKITTQQRAESLPVDVELVVATAAVSDAHPEIAEALRRGIPVLRYAEMLGLMMTRHHGVAISGTHGKSTTTAWTAFVLREAGLDPSFVVGAGVAQLGGGSGVGSGPHFIAEACEFAKSFLTLRPKLAAILNVEADHLDYYRDLDEIRAAFGEFAGLVPPNGVLVLNGDDPNCRELAANAAARVDTFGIDGDCNWNACGIRVENGFHAFTALRDGHELGRVRLGVAGRHNVMNGLAVMALATHCGVDWPTLQRVLGEFEGAKRRLELKGAVNDVRVVDDYAHHPSEIRATLAAARERFAPRRLWCVFQPHQYSRTRQLLDEFASAFAAADEVVVPPIFAARDSEEDRRAVSAQAVAERIRGNGRSARHIADFENIVDFLASEARPGDVVLTMGAGNIGKIADDLVQRLGGVLPG